MRCLLVLVSGLSFVAAAPAFAEMVEYDAELRGASEVPPTDSTAKGEIDADYDTATKKLKWEIEYSGLSGPATAAHFHGPAAATANAGPVITLDATKLASPIKGEATLTDAQASDLAKGLWYLNIHTAKHPPGEIRGQLLRD
jgi:hypothetical protein